MRGEGAALASWHQSSYRPAAFLTLSSFLTLFILNRASKSNQMSVFANNGLDFSIWFHEQLNLNCKKN